MKFIRPALLFLCVVFCAMSGYAQNQHWRGNIPFAFKIKNQSFQPGVYDILIDANRGIVSLANHQNPGAHMLWIGVPSDHVDLATMHFALAGGTYMLTSVMAGNWSTPTPHVPNNAQEAKVVFPQ